MCAASTAAGVVFAHAIRAFRFVRDYCVVVQGASGAMLIALGLLLFFDRSWWLQVGLDQATTSIGLSNL